MIFALLLSLVLFEGGRDGVTFKIETENKTVDPAQSIFLRTELVVPHDKSAVMPNLRDRVVGFSIAEDFEEDPVRMKDGSSKLVSVWRLFPEPCATTYKIKPFAVKASPKIYKARSDEGRFSFVAGPVYFDPPAVREPVTGAMECDPKKDLPPFSWRLAGWIALALAAASLLVTGLVLGMRYVARRVKEHRMSPIERAWVELDRLIKKGLPGRGRYKDFYVELTMVVRRYVQRKYGVRAPNLTTEEFLREISVDGKQVSVGQRESLRRFLESADMVKFAGVEATPEMADGATEAARGYLRSDSAEASK